MKYALSLLLGALLPFAFAPYGIWPLAILIPALLLWVLAHFDDRRGGFLSGWLFGLGYFGIGVYWIYNSLHDFGMAPPVVAVAITALLVVYLALYPALTLFIYQRIRDRVGEKALWLLPLLWFSLEWAKGWILTGMPWLSLGYSQTTSPLAGFAPLIGVYGLGGLCLLLSVALYLAVAKKRYRWLSLLLILPAAGWMLQAVDWTRPQAAALTVSMVQGNIPQQLKWRPEQRQNIFNTYWRETSRLWGSDLIVWPETALPGRSEQIEQSILRPMEQVAKQRNTAILTGVMVSDSANKKIFNSVMLVGQQRQVYHKRHLVIFGEYYPMRWLLDFLRGWINIPYSDLTPGPEDQPPMTVRGSNLGLSICFEDVFSRDIALALPGANLFVNVSNDAWFGDSSAPHQHLQIAQMRSLEFERPMVRATNTGVSAFIDRKGRVIAQIDQFKTRSLGHDLWGRKGQTPFYYFVGIQGILAAVIFLLSVFFGFSRPRR